MKKQLETCKNCECNFSAGFQFCPHCGQKTKDELTLRVLFYNTISNYFSFDARFFKSFLPLLFKPGYLPKRFVEGKRLLYLHPAQFYLFISIVFFFLFSFVAREQRESLDKALQKDFEKKVNINTDTKKITDSIKVEKFLKPLKDNKIITEQQEGDIQKLDSIIKAENNNTSTSFDFNTKKVDSLIAADASDENILKAMGLEENAGSFTRKFYTQILKFYKQRNGGSILQTFYDSIPLTLFILLPIFALILKLLFFRKGRFAHHLVFSFYYFSFLFTIFSLVLLTNFILDIPDWIDWMIYFSTFFYLLFAIKRFYNKGYVSSFFKTSIATFIFMLMVIPLTVVVMGIAAFMFY